MRAAFGSPGKAIFSQLAKAHSAEGMGMTWPSSDTCFVSKARPESSVAGN
jgi:hypothetical protein